MSDILISRFLIIMTVLSVCLPARAADPDNQTETKVISPIISEEVLPTEPHELEVRFGTDYRQGNSVADGVLPYMETNFGLMEGVGGSLNIPAAYHKENADAAYGIGDISVTFKYLAVPCTRSIPAVVLSLQTQFPSGNKHLGLGSGAYELTPCVGFLKYFGPLLFQGNIGWAKEVTGKRESTWVYDWAAAIPVYQHKLYLLTEINRDFGSPTQTDSAPGIKYLFSKKFSVGVAAPIGLNSNSETWGMVSQFEFEF